MTTPTLLDLGRAQQYAPEDDLLRELVITFEQSLGQETAKIRDGLAHGDKEKVEYALHALKGFMPLFACEPVAQAVANLYQASRQQPLEATAPVFAALAPDLDQLLQEVRAWLAGA